MKWKIELIFDIVRNVGILLGGILIGRGSPTLVICGVGVVVVAAFMDVVAVWVFDEKSPAKKTTRD